MDQKVVELGQRERLRDTRDIELFRKIKGVILDLVIDYFLSL